MLSAGLGEVIRLERAAHNRRARASPLPAVYPDLYHSERKMGAEAGEPFPFFVIFQILASNSSAGLWCDRRDSNPHDFTHCHLKAARLPIPPRALFFRIGTRLRRTASRPDRDPINGADVTNQRWRDKARERGGFQRDPMGRGSICLTSTAIRLRSTRTTPLAIGRLLARILTSSASVASSSMMAPRLRRIT